MAEPIIAGLGGSTIDALARLAPLRPIFVESGDRLIIQSRNAVAGVTLAVRGRVLTPAGEIVPLEFAQTPNTNRTGLLSEFPIGPCFLLDLHVTVTAGTVRRGQCYVEVSLARGTLTARFRYAVLARGYVTGPSSTAFADFPLTWPYGGVEGSLEGPGIIRSVTGTDPAAGAEVSETVPTGARWRFYSLTVQLVTDATVATRRPRLQLQDASAVQLWVMPHAATATASTTTIVSWVSGVAHVATLGAGSFPITAPTTQPLLQGFILLTTTEAIVAGDNYGAPQMLMEEWLEP